MKKNDLYNIVAIISAFFIISLIFNFKFFKSFSYTSHSNEPKIGDKVRNNNPSCKHYKSIGKVKKIDSLKNDQGKVITYEVENDASTYCPGQVLSKTMDQITKL